MNSRPHDETMVELLREDPAFADEYLAACLEDIDQPEGREALLMAVRQAVEAGITIPFDPKAYAAKLKRATPAA